MKEKLDILSSSDLILMPSNHEPFGLVALEALSAGQNGKTILCSSFVDGMGEFLTEDSAIKCGTSSNEITEGIYKFLNMKEIDKKNMRNNGCKLAQKYTWDDCVKQIENTYDSI